MDREEYITGGFNKGFNPNFSESLILYYKRTTNYVIHVVAVLCVSIFLDTLSIFLIFLFNSVLFPKILQSPVYFYLREFEFIVSILVDSFKCKARDPSMSCY